MSQQRPCHTQLCVGTLNAVDVRSSILIRLPGCLPQIATAASKQQQQEGPARSSKEHSIQLLSPSALLAWPSARGKNKRSERVPKEVRMVSTYTTANMQSIQGENQGQLSSEKRFEQILLPSGDKKMAMQSPNA